MTKQLPASDENRELNVWAREDAFPPAPEGFGWIDRKEKQHPCASLEELSKTIREDKKYHVVLVWTPEAAFCHVPEEIVDLAEPIKAIKADCSIEDLANTQHRLKQFSIGFALIIGYIAYQVWIKISAFEQANATNISFIKELELLLDAFKKSATVGISLLVFLIFAFIPWYQARKRAKEIASPESLKISAIPAIRFETWLDYQKSPFTYFILFLICLVFLAQVIADRSIIFFHSSIDHAGLLKANFRDGEYWRLLTAPMLHGGIVHFVMNASALLYLGKRLEVFARWPHLPTVFIFSALVAGEASSRFAEANSVGASGGLMGWLGFLLVFETLHSRLVPISSRRRLLGGVFLTAVIGLIGYRFIDNAAHIGGLLAGMVYAGIVFPKSTSAIRPTMNLTDRIVGFSSLGLIAFASVFSILKIFS